MKRNAGAREHFGACEQIIEVAVAAKRNDVRMLDDQQLVGNFAALALLGKLLLEGQSFGVTDPSKVPQVQITHRSRDYALMARP